MGFAFVDDTNLCVTHPSNCIKQVAQHMQGSVSTWEGLLRATGGALVPDKCFWYLIDFKSRHGKWHYCSVASTPAFLYVHDHLGRRTLIPRLETSEARRTLGVRISPDGNMRTELQ